jgi:phosphatidylserine/phosphatidylglycerophosphate/cardiolipin synthase-like enzyme
MSSLYPLPDAHHAAPHRTAGDSRCEFFLGQNAGTELLQDLQRARRSIVVVSPYASVKLLEQLGERQAAGVHVTLVTTTDAGRGVGPALVQQTRHIDTRAKELRSHLKIGGVAAIVVMVLVAFWMAMDQAWAAFGVAVLGAAAGALAYQYGENLRIYSYSYRYLFPAVRVFESPYGNGHPSRNPRRMFVHSKAYVIDGEVAYLGSLNFTSSGMTHNYESCVRFTEPGAVGRIAAMVDSLCTGTGWDTRDAASWGPALYDEPAN